MRTIALDITFSDALHDTEIDEYILEIKAFAGVVSVEERKTGDV